MRPLHILQVATQSTTAFKFILPFALYLRNQGHRVTIACTDEAFSDAASYMNELRASGLSIKVLRMKRPISPRKDAQIFAEALCWMKSQAFDVVHTHNAKAGVLGRSAAYAARVPVIVHTNHGLPFYVADRFSAFENMLHLWIERAVGLVTDRVFVVSHEELEKAARFRVVPRARMVYTSQGIDIRFFSPQPLEVRRTQRARFGLRDGDPLVGVIARLVEHKGVDCFLDAAAQIRARVPRAQFLVVGDGEERDALEHRAKALGLETAVHFVGHRKDPHEIRSFYAAMDLFLCPTRWESFGIVFIEAMSMGVPVIGPYIEPIRSVVMDAGVLVEGDNTEAFAEAAVRLLKNPKECAALRTKGQERVRANFDEEALFERLYETYQKIIETN